MLLKVLLILATIATGIASWFFFVTARATEDPARGLAGFIMIGSTLLAAGLWTSYIAVSRRLRGDATADRWHRRGWGDGWDR